MNEPKTAEQINAPQTGSVDPDPRKVIRFGRPMMQKYYPAMDGQRGSFVAGEYFCHCYDCGAEFCGDKRDSICPVCEYRNMSTRITLLMDQNARMRKVLEEFISKVDSGLARSRDTYTKAKAALA